MDDSTESKTRKRTQRTAAQWWSIMARHGTLPQALDPLRTAWHLDAILPIPPTHSITVFQSIT